MRLLQIGCVLLAINPSATSAADRLTDLLKEPILGQKLANRQHTEFIAAHIPKLKPAPSAAAWQTEARRLRGRVLREVVFRGVPKRWRAPNPRVEWQGVIKGDGYRIRKLRVEALPGLWIPALLYEPDKVSGRVPAVLNVNGHDRNGKASEYKQIRCINQAKRGMLALNLEWIGMGQMRTSGLSHNHLAKLDLCGRSGLSVFYLAMSRGLDVLLAHPHADAKRVAVTGLSGGGWQTIVLSSLDDRVRLTVPVAGYSALGQRLTHQGSIGDLEQVPNDLIWIADYAHLTAMMVPRPTLLIYNDKDTCCFVSRTVKPNTFDPIVPFFAQANAARSFEYHENSDPGDHNYGLDNRQQLYKFLGKHFYPNMKNFSGTEISTKGEVRTAKELHVELPKQNADFHSLAQRASQEVAAGRKMLTVQEQIDQLRATLRWKTLKVEKAAVISKVKTAEELTVEQIRLKLGHWQLPACVVSPAKARGTVMLLNDNGSRSDAKRIAELAGQGLRIVCFDPSYVGEAKPTGQLYQHVQMVASVGRRPLGIQAAQIVAACEYVKARYEQSLTVRTAGPRTGIAGLCAASLARRKLIAKIESEKLPKSLAGFVEPSASYNATPEVFCFGLFRVTDIPLLIRLANRR